MKPSIALLESRGIVHAERMAAIRRAREQAGAMSAPWVRDYESAQVAPGILSEVRGSRQTEGRASSLAKTPTMPLLPLSETSRWSPRGRDIPMALLGGAIIAGVFWVTLVIVWAP